MPEGSANPSSAPEPDPLTVICVEDNADVLRLISLALESAPGLSCICAFDNADHLLQMLEGGASPPDIIVTDWSMPGTDGRALVRSVRAAWPQVRVIVYTAYSHAAVIDAACDAGAWGVVSKTGGFNALISAIHEVADGRMVIQC